jgi:hypothetical protein
MSSATKADLTDPRVRRIVWKNVGESMGFDSSLADELERVSGLFLDAAVMLSGSEYPEDRSNMQSAYLHLIDEIQEAKRNLKRAADTARGVAVLAASLSAEEGEGERYYSPASFRKVGRVVKAADPDTARMLRREDGITSLEGIGRYVLAADPEQFERIIEEDRS